jgi:hypothetical protein
LLAVSMAVLYAAAACGERPVALETTIGSPERLADAVLDALAARDRQALAALAVSGSEFRQRVWPELPASRPERNVPLQYAWNDLAQKSSGGLSAVLAAYGGQRFTLRRVEFLGEKTIYRTFAIQRKTELVVTDAGGAEQRIRVFGSIIHADGLVKVFSYIVD